MNQVLDLGSPSVPSHQSSAQKAEFWKLPEETQKQLCGHLILGHAFEQCLESSPGILPWMLCRENSPLSEGKAKPLGREDKWFLPGVPQAT